MNPFRIPRTIDQAITLGLLHGSILAIVVLVGVFASGSTFGQRCDRAHPTDGAAAHACVERLSGSR